MKKIILALGVSFIAVSCLSILYVAITAFIDPRKVMSLVGIKELNNDAASSIRGVYGGVGLLLTGVFAYEGCINRTKCLFLLFAFWGLYASSRVITQIYDGPLGEFGTSWLRIESSLSVIALFLAGCQIYLSFKSKDPSTVKDKKRQSIRTHV